ncbi:hypothetical protein DXG01_013037 [Tephrocybe rancida]|nr:hypothetical protein DXG01_013037 [Tephrocybe rancida]
MCLWIGSINGFLLIAGGIVAGRLYDRGHLWRHTVSSNENNVDTFCQAFLAQGLAAGLGGGLTFVPSFAICSQYFTTKRTLALSIVASGGSLGAVVHPIMFNNLVGKLGFGNAVRANAGVEAGLLLLACCLMRERTSTKKAPLQNSKEILRNLSTDYAYIAATLGFVGRVVPGLLANTLGVMSMVVFVTAASAAVIFGMIGLKDISGVVFIALFYGLLSGADYAWELLTSSPLSMAGGD